MAKKRIFIILIIAIISYYLFNLIYLDIKGKEIYVVSNDITKGTVLTENDISKVNVSYLKDETIFSNNPVGMYAIEDIKKGEFIYNNMLINLYSIDNDLEKSSKILENVKVVAIYDSKNNLINLSNEYYNTYDKSSECSLVIELKKDEVLKVKNLQKTEKFQISS